MWPLTVWWIGFTLGGIASRIANARFEQGETAVEIRDAGFLYLMVDASDLFVLALAALVVVRISQRLDARAREMGDPPEPELEPA